MLLQLTLCDLPRVLIANNLHVDGFPGRREEDTFDEVLVHPRLQLAHPKDV